MLLNFYFTKIYMVYNYSKNPKLKKNLKNTSKFVNNKNFKRVMFCCPMAEIFFLKSYRSYHTLKRNLNSKLNLSAYKQSFFSKNLQKKSNVLLAFPKKFNFDLLQNQIWKYKKYKYFWKTQSFPLEILIRIIKNKKKRLWTVQFPKKVLLRRFSWKERVIFKKSLYVSKMRRNFQNHINFYFTFFLKKLNIKKQQLTALFNLRYFNQNNNVTFLFNKRFKLHPVLKDFVKLSNNSGSNSGINLLICRPFYNRNINKIFSIKHIWNFKNFQQQKGKKIKIKYTSILFKKNYQYKLNWEKINVKFNKKLNVKKKSFVKKYISYIFFREYNKRLYRIETNIKKSFLRYLKFFKVIKRKIKNKTKISTFFTLQKKKATFFEKEKKNERKTIKQFIFQRRKNKEGFGFWKNYNTRWLYLNLLKYKTIKFYFNPIRIKPQIIRKKWKYLNIYKRFQQQNPRLGQWSTIGLIGNYMARNTLYIKKKVLFFIFSNFYKIKNKNFLTRVNKKKTKIYSQFNNHLTIILKVFEQRLDILIFRANLVVNLDLARLLISRGYINVNFIIKQNIACQMQTNDFISIVYNFRNIIREFTVERYESFRKVYLNRFYKTPYMDLVSKYISTILISLKYLITKQIWIKTFAQIHKFLNSFLLWNPEIAISKIKNLRIRAAKFCEESNNVQPFKHIKWRFLNSKNGMLNQRINNIHKYFNKKKYKSLKTHYKYAINNLYFITNKTSILYKNNKHTTKLNLKIFNLITKDVLVQTWETFPKSLIINLKFRYVLVLQRFTLNFSHSFKNPNNFGRLNIKHISWLLKN